MTEFERRREILCRAYRLLVERSNLMPGGHLKLVYGEVIITLQKPPYQRSYESFSHLFVDLGCAGVSTPVCAGLVDYEYKAEDGGPVFRPVILRADLASAEREESVLAILRQATLLDDLAAI